MIVMIVAEQDDVDARKILPLHAGRTPALRADPLQWARALRPDRISQNVHVAELKQDRRMIDEGDSQFAVGNTGGRFRRLDVIDEARRPFGPAGELPAQDVEEASHLRSIWIEESLPVEMFRKFACAHRMLRSSERLA